MNGVIEQEIREGYKQTEVGFIPDDWVCKPLGEYGDVVRGGSPRPAGDPKYFKGNYIPWLTVASLTNIPSSQLYVTSTATMLTKLGSLQSRTLDKGTLIISNSGATLGVAKILGIKCCANDGVAAIINQRIGNKEFLVQFINTKTKELHDEVATGNGQPNLNTDLIRIIPTPYPPEKEQTAIANALSDVDALITSLESLITKKRAIKTAAMQQLLTGKKRLPPFDKTHTGYKQTELGEIPEDWEWKLLPELVISGGNAIKIGPFGSALKKEYLTKDGYKVYGQENVYDKDMVVG
ncbi:MAG: restriction endonuclease subunit S, partial [Candidatus Sedimenticola sp. (ex Thyasira tokunagai)]